VPWRDLLRALRGVWVACLSLAAAGLLVRLLVGDAWPAWQVLLTQIAACSAAYVLTLALTDRSMLALVWGSLRRVMGRKVLGRAGGKV